MRLDYHSSESLAPVIEALLFASDDPLDAQTLRALILGEETPTQESLPDESVKESGREAPDANLTESTDAVATDAVLEVPVVIPEKKRKKRQLIELPTVHAAVEQLNAFYENNGRAYRIVEIAGGYQFATRSEYGEYVARLFKEKSRRRLSGAALESLAIIAYKQPVSKNDIENIRGVNCDEVLKSLLEKNLITITGRADSVGRPLLYGTTVDFLRHFGLHSIADLPRAREIDELMKEESVRATTLDEAASEFVSPEFASTADDLTVDEAIAVAKELAELEEATFPREDVNSLEDEIGIGFDLSTLERTSPGHPEVIGEEEMSDEPSSDEEPNN